MTNADGLLMRTPAYQPLESPLHYVLRLSEANGYPTPNNVIQLATHDREWRAGSRWNYTALNSVLPSCRHLPASFSYRWEASEKMCDLSLLGKYVLARHLDASHAGICPECVRELGFIPAWWDIRYAIACPNHRRMFVRACPCCDKLISELRPGLLTCSCGASLDVDSDGNLTDAVIWLMQLLQQKAEANSSPSSTLPLSERLLKPEDVSLNLLCKILENAARAETRMAQSRAITPRRNQWNEYVSNVARFLWNWPSGVSGLCSRWRAYARLRGAKRQTLRAAYPWAFDSLFKNLGDERRETLFVLEAVMCCEVAARGGYPLDIRADDLRQVLRGDHVYCSIARASALSGISPRTIIRLAKRRAIPCRVRRRVSHNRKRLRYAIRTDVARTLTLAHHAALDHRRASERLGVTHSLYRDLRHCDVLKKQLTTEVRTAIAILDLDEFKQSLLSRAEQPSSSNSLVSFDALRRARCPRTAIVRMFQAILNGSMICYRQASSSRLDELLVNRADVARVVSACRPSQPTIVQFQERYSLNSSEVCALAAHLAGANNPIRTAIPKLLIASEFDRFTSRFRGVAAYARAKEIRYKAALTQLRLERAEILDFPVPSRHFCAHFFCQ